MNRKRKVLLILFLFLIMISIGKSMTRITDIEIETTGNAYINGHILVLDYLTVPKINAINISTDLLSTDSLKVDNIRVDNITADRIILDNGYNGSCINTTFLNGIAIGCND